jgi:hypothetical protein
MARLTDRQRLVRAMELLAGLGHPDVRSALEPRGLSSQELEDGFSLLRAAIQTFHGGEQRDVPSDSLALLDAWENRWLPICRAALERRFPQVAKSVFLNIRQTRGVALLVTLPTLLDRLEALEHAELDAARQAHVLLAQRGLSSAVIAEARAVLRDTRALPRALPPLPAVDTRARNLDALWGWYLDWSQTARATLSEPALLRLLGFGKPGRPRG